MTCLARTISLIEMLFYENSTHAMSAFSALLEPHVIDFIVCVTVNLLRMPVALHNAKLV